MSATDTGWPIYFAKKPLTGARVNLRKGDVFPLQNKSYIRALGPHFGRADAERCAFSDLVGDYVEIVDVGTAEQAELIARLGLTLAQTRALLAGKLRLPPSPEQ